MTASVRHPRLTGPQIGVLRLLLQRTSGLGRGVTLGVRQRAAVVALWRRGLVECWYRQAPEVSPSLQGPYFTLSLAGFNLACCFVRRR